MAEPSKSFLVVNVHPTDASVPAPIPVRERVVSPYSGHAVRLVDWALLAEMLAEREDIYSPDERQPIDAYPDCFIDRGYPPQFSRFTHYGLIENLTPPSSTDSEGVLRSSKFIDPVFDFSDEPYSGNSSSYDVFRRGHGLPLSQTVLSNRRPRSIDDLRRRFYDIKRSTRRTIPYRAISLTEDVLGAYGFNGAEFADREYFEDRGTCSQLEVDLSAFVEEGVLAHRNFSATPRYILAKYVIADGNGGGTRFRTTWLPIDVDGAVSTAGIMSSGCMAVYDDELGPGPTGDGESYVQGSFFLANGYPGNYVVVCDFRYPNDGLLSPWGWMPPSS